MNCKPRLRFLAAFFLLCGLNLSAQSPTRPAQEPPQAQPSAPAPTQPPPASISSSEPPQGVSEESATIDPTNGEAEASSDESTPKPLQSPVVSNLGSNSAQARILPSGTSQAMRIVLGLSVLAVLPALLVCVTSFLRTIIVLSMLRHAMGMQETPPNMVLTGLALFLTLFIMAPTLQKVNEGAFQPFMAGSLSMEAAYAKGVTPLRDFMVRQTREQDLALMVELSKANPPKSMEDISNVQLIPAYMLSELRSAFQIGFVIFLPFLLIDLVVGSILMALGMMMVPPTTISLPFKILMFVLVDGWALVMKALVGSFH